MQNFKPETTVKPWPAEKLALHVTQRIRENVQISTMIEHELDDDGDEHHVLRDRGEHYLWSVILEAVGDAGWQLSAGTPELHSTLLNMLKRQEPLGADFEKVLYENLWDLYVRRE